MVPGGALSQQHGVHGMQSQTQLSICTRPKPELFPHTPGTACSLSLLTCQKVGCFLFEPWSQRTLDRRPGGPTRAGRERRTEVSSGQSHKNCLLFHCRFHNSTKQKTADSFLDTDWSRRKPLLILFSGSGELREPNEIAKTLSDPSRVIQ